MESNYSNKDFEQFVKQSADQYRMYPSPKVWKGIYGTLHGRRRWYYGLGIALLLLTSGVVTWIMVVPGERQPGNPGPMAETQTTSKVVNETEKQPDILNPNTAKTKNKIVVPFAINDPVEDENFIVEDQLTLPRNFSDEAMSLLVVSNIPEAAKANPTIISGNIPVQKIIAAPASETQIKLVMTEENSTLIPITSQATAKTEYPNPAPEMKAVEKEIYPFTIESVLNSYQRNRKKLSWQVYFTPTVSYRRLTENKDFLEANRNTGPGYLYIPDINNAVKHKPDMGVNLGVTAGYPLSKKFRLTAGLQFVISKYDIQASYTYQSEQATVALNTGFRGNNTVTANTNYRNYTGAKENWLRNLYVSASLPIGADFVIKGDNKNPALGVAATIQPIYVLDNKAYLISTDYKNYVVIPSLINQWNLGTSVEAYAGYNTGHLRWRVGPQVRYHLGSSFQKTYPVKEHLFDFGLKVGVMLNQ